MFVPRNLNAAPEQFKSGFELLKAKFGLFYEQQEDRWSFEESDLIPLIPGYNFGWRIRLISPKSAIRWREIMQLPGTPLSWSIEDDSTVTLAAGNLAITKATAPTSEK